MPKVGIFSLGFLTLNVPKLCHFLNSTQKHYTFESATEITNLGRPDLKGYGYSVQKLYKFVTPHLEQYEFGVLFTLVPLEGNFFTKTLNQRIIISTFHQSDELLEKSGRSLEEYAAITIAQELISFEFQRVTGKPWNNLFHQDPRGCIFDFAGIKNQKIGKLINCSICKPCLGILRSSNLNMNAVSSVQKIIDAIVKPSLVRAFSLSMKKPGLSFIYGGIVLGTVVNLLSSLVLNQQAITQKQYLLISSIASGIILFPLAIYGWQWFQYLKRKIKGI